MNPIETIACNFTYTAPAGVPPEQCGSLPCTRVQGSITSYWQLTDEERKYIAAGGIIHLTILGTGRGHPMVSLTTGPADDAEPQGPSATDALAYVLGVFATVLYSLEYRALSAPMLRSLIADKLPDELPIILKNHGITWPGSCTGILPVSPPA